MRRTKAVVAVVGALLAAGCSGHSAGHRSAGPTTSPPAPTSTSAPAAATVWLCRPGHLPDPCASSLASTAVLVDGSRRREPLPSSRPQGVDCFYVYPTVSLESGANADLRIQPAQVSVARAQASRFSSVCDVWAPMYRQRTVGDLFRLPDDAAGSGPNQVAYRSLRAAWLDYLAHDNHGRPVVLIGHSQGASMLIRLVRSDIDPDPTVRGRVLLAILLGGNVTVATGRTTGGSFRHLPLCTRPGQTGCVIAYSSFPGQPPPGAFFGRPGSGVSLLSGETESQGRQVACVNPADIGGGRALLHPYLPTGAVHSGVATPWTSYPDRFTAQCRTGGGATWLQVSSTHLPGETRTFPRSSLGPLWGYHTVDVNLALGDLVHDVAAATATWTRRRG